jgi:hypothetical protein
MALVKESTAAYSAISPSGAVEVAVTSPAPVSYKRKKFISKMKKRFRRY